MSYLNCSYHSYDWFVWMSVQLKQEYFRNYRQKIKIMAWEKYNRKLPDIHDNFKLSKHLMLQAVIYVQECMNLPN